MKTDHDKRADESVVTLSRALDQTGDVLAGIPADRLGNPTPCPEWDLDHLVGHVVETPRKFLAMARGEQPDWAAGPPAAGADYVSRFRNAADDLIHSWHQQGAAADPGAVDWQTAELAVHTWDLLRASGQQHPLDPEIAERGLAFMRAALTDENRGGVFGPEVPLDDPDASPYDRLAAFAGRDPR